MMPQIETWPRFPPGNVDETILSRMRERKISLDDLNRLRIWIESGPTFPWYKDFGSFKICPGEGAYPKTFLLAGQTANGPETVKLDP